MLADSLVGHRHLLCILSGCRLSVACLGPCCTIFRVTTSGSSVTILLMHKRHLGPSPCRPSPELCTGREVVVVEMGSHKGLFC